MNHDSHLRAEHLEDLRGSPDDLTQEECERTGRCDATFRVDQERSHAELSRSLTADIKPDIDIKQYMYFNLSIYIKTKPDKGIKT